MTPSEREQRILDRLSEWSTRNAWAARVARMKTRELIPGFLPEWPYEARADWPFERAEAVAS